ncbi:type I-E CRISPR-associated protein Cse1/CasA [Candidatus Falkowbacteria bacterium]|nr:type I-E CRISPR-associated protein Cse1/CasA [Candidatus Falkowbacteria bacterium]
MPVHEPGEIRDIDLASLLTQDTPRTLSLAGDDMEAAALQLLSALTRTLFTPADGAAYHRRLRTPLTPAEYRATVRDYRHWFELFHPQTPFLQTRGVPATEPTRSRNCLSASRRDHPDLSQPG